jgi:hypothetical protein
LLFFILLSFSSFPFPFMFQKIDNLLDQTRLDKN